MKFYSSLTSPYVRKVRAMILETGLQNRIDEVLQKPQSPAYHGKNPLARVPAFEAKDGTVLFDSPVICEYLDSQHRGRKMIPAKGAARWRVLRQQALADGIMDTAVPLRRELARPARERNKDQNDYDLARIQRAVGELDREAKAGGLSGRVDLGRLAAACALGYLDFRYPDLPWRARRPALSAWYEKFSQRPSISGTQPRDG